MPEYPSLWLHVRDVVVFLDIEPILIGTRCVAPTIFRTIPIALSPVVVTMIVLLRFAIQVVSAVLEFMQLIVSKIPDF